jgi:DNA invertase Pin-like site-specific DNA recombinase
MVAAVASNGQLIGERTSMAEMDLGKRPRYVAYYRVSTERQGRSGLGLDAQRTDLRSFVAGRHGAIVAEFQEVESGKREDNRPELRKAMDHCALTGATLLVAKLDRLSRDAEFLLRLQKSKVKFTACDMPEANEMTVGLMAVIAQGERKLISERTKKALAAAKARGVRLGATDNSRIKEHGKKGTERSAKVRMAAADERAGQVMEYIRSAQAAGAGSLREIAAYLNERGIPTARGRTWDATAVARVLKRAN